MANKNLDYTIRWQTDQAALNKTLQDAKRLDTTIDSGVDQFVAMAKRGELSMDQLRAALRDVARVGDAEIDKITQSLKEADAAAKQLQDTSETGLITASGRALLKGEREEGRFQSFALGTLGNIPGVGGSDAFGAASAVFDLVDALPNLQFALQAVKASVIENVAAIGATGVGLVGVLGIGALALKVITDAEAARAEAARKAAAQLLSTAQQVAGGATSADFRDQNTGLERQRTVLQEGQAALEDYRESIRLANDSYGRGITTSEEYRNALAAINASLHDATGGVLGLKDGVGQSVSQVGDFNGVLDANQKNIDAVTSAIAANNIALVSQAVEENDAAARRAERDQRLIASEQAYLAADQMTADQRQKHVDEIQKEIDSYQFLIDNGNLTAATTNELIDRIRNLNVEQTAYKNTVQSTADVLAAAEAATKAVNDQTDAYSDALKEEGEIRDEIAAINRKIADIQLATAEKVLAIETERDERLAQITSEYADKRGELTADGEEKRQQIIADSNEKIAKIQRDSGRKLFNLVAQRDALAYYLESIQAAQQIKDEQDAASKSLEQQKKAEDKSFAQAQKAYDKSIQQQIAAADKSIRAQYDAANRQLQLQYSAQQAQQVALENLQISLQNIALYGSNGQRVIHTQMWNDLASFAYTGAQNVVGMFMAGLTGGGSSQFPTLTSTYGAAIPTTQQAFDRQFDRRMAETLGIGYGQIRGY